MNNKKVKEEIKLNFIKKALEDKRYLPSIYIFVSYLLPEIKVGETMDIPLLLAGKSTIRNNVSSLRKAGYKLDLAFDTETAFITCYKRPKK